MVLVSCLFRTRKVFPRKTEDEWAREVMSCYTFIGDIKSLEAQRWFLQIFRFLPCEKSTECVVTACEDFPVELKEKHPMTLQMNCAGLLFFAPAKASPQFDSFPSPVLNINYSQLGKCEPNRDGLYVEAAIKGKMLDFHLKTKTARTVKDVVEAHGDFRKFSELYKKTRSCRVEIDIPDMTSSRSSPTEQGQSSNLLSKPSNSAAYPKMDPFSIKPAIFRPMNRLKKALSHDFLSVNVERTITGWWKVLLI